MILKNRDKIKYVVLMSIIPGGKKRLRGAEHSELVFSEACSRNSN
jgi:hypothetical protein